MTLGHYWSGMINQGVTFSKNPWGTGVFGGAYFSVTGIELLHVIAALIALLVVGLGYKAALQHHPHRKLQSFLAVYQRRLDVCGAPGLSHEPYKFEIRNRKGNVIMSTPELKGGWAKYRSLYRHAGHGAAGTAYRLSPCGRTAVLVTCCYSPLSVRCWAYSLIGLASENHSSVVAFAVFTLFVLATINYGWPDSFRLLFGVPYAR